MLPSLSRNHAPRSPLAALPTGAYALVIGLPLNGSQVNNDPANGIDPHQDAAV
jgi:hypothetical protein